MRCEICGKFWFKKYIDAVAFSYSKTVKFRMNEDLYIYVCPSANVSLNKKTGKMTCNICSPSLSIFGWLKSIFLHKRG